MPLSRLRAFLARHAPLTDREQGAAAFCILVFFLVALARRHGAL